MALKLDFTTEDCKNWHFSRNVSELSSYKSSEFRPHILIASPTILRHRPRTYSISWCNYEVLITSKVGGKGLENFCKPKVQDSTSVGSPLSGKWQFKNETGQSDVTST